MDERGSESGQACEDEGYFYLAETDAWITVQEISIDSGFQVDSRVIKCNCNNLTTKQPISVSTNSFSNPFLDQLRPFRQVSRVSGAAGKKKVLRLF